MFHSYTELLTISDGTVISVTSYGATKLPSFRASVLRESRKNPICPPMAFISPLTPSFLPTLKPPILLEKKPKTAPYSQHVTHQK